VTGSVPSPEPGVRPSSAMAGRTGLPLSIWPGVPGPGCPVPGNDFPCPGRCPGLGAWPVITAFSRPGDLVVMIPAVDCAVLAAATAGTGRRILGITVGPPEVREASWAAITCLPERR
jgi:hypothetical protein